ncbi:unnamed protein product [Nezara viridula]|uniref:Uncharacterized protein n=1 Tax=Nezara viridula TaxID=85310 RepID=A0A9P0HD77_NEZVI|nr:unnamed protein product [Nezara viridula]
MTLDFLDEGGYGAREGYEWIGDSERGSTLPPPPRWAPRESAPGTPPVSPFHRSVQDMRLSTALLLLAFAFMASATKVPTSTRVKKRTGQSYI